MSEYSEISASDSGEEEEDVESRPRKRARGSTVSSDQGSILLMSLIPTLTIDEVTTKQTKYAILKTETRQVEAKVIKDKWRPTTAAAQAKVKTILSLVERPVINSNRDLEQRKKAQTSLAALSRMYVFLAL